MTRSMLAFLAILVSAGGLILLMLLRQPAGAQDAAETPRPTHDPLTTRLSDEGDPGQRIYLRYCSGCHGVRGDGKGPAAEFLDPKPRDFTRGIYKFTSTPAGSPPLDEDLTRTITYGLKGTSMPGWRFLPLHQREQLVRYIRAFDTEERYPEPAVTFHSNPFDVSYEDGLGEAIKLGKEVYHKTATCWQCHPSYLDRAELEALTGGAVRDDLQLAIGKPDLWGQVVMPPDFRRAKLKSVRTLKDLYRSVAAGIGGTAMPTWVTALSAEQLWALTIYVDSIGPTSVVGR